MPSKITITGGAVLPVIHESEHYVLCGPPKGHDGKTVHSSVVLSALEDLHRQGYRLCGFYQHEGTTVSFFEKKTP